MCFEFDGQPPIMPIRGASVDHSDLVLRADDGNEFAAFAATGGGDPAVVILPDVRGLYAFYEELALRFTEHGHDAIAIDYFGRSAGIGKRDAGFDYMPHVRQTTYEGVRSDVATAIAHLREQDPARRVVTVGFCFGGSNSWYQASNGHGLAGAIGFYGNPDRTDVPRGAAAVIDVVARMECPILALQGGDDPGISRETSERFEAALTEANVPNDVVVYDGAPHSFFDRSYEEHADASADAWRRVLGFLDSV